MNKKRLQRLETQLRRVQTQEVDYTALQEDPSAILRGVGQIPDPWQETVLRSSAHQILLLASRQAGKSSVAAVLALATALSRPGAPVLLLSPTLRQSGELFRVVRNHFHRLGRPGGVREESKVSIEFRNRSRIVCLPGMEGTVRGFSGVALVVIDEAARVADALYLAVRPMLSVSQGRLIALSTPFGKRGWFHDEWHGSGDWQRVRATAEECPRITAEFLAEEQRAMGPRWFRQEYMCSFEDAIDSVFSEADIQRAFAHNEDVRPMFEAHENPFAP